MCGAQSVLILGSHARESVQSVQKCPWAARADGNQAMRLSPGAESEAWFGVKITDVVAYAVKYPAEYIFTRPAIERRRARRRWRRTGEVIA